MRKKRRHERSEGKRGRRKRASEGEEKGRSVGGRETGREGNFKGGTARDMGIAVIPPSGVRGRAPEANAFWELSFEN